MGFSLHAQVVVIAAGYCTRAYRLKTGSTQVRHADTLYDPRPWSTSPQGMKPGCLMLASEGCSPCCVHSGP